MTTKVWKADYENELAYTRASLVNVKDFRRIKTMTGEPLAGVFPGAQVRIESNDPPADYFTAGTLFIVSSRLKAILEGFSVRVEPYPVDVTYHGVLYKEAQYFFLNILDEADCLDRTAARYAEKSGYVGDISKLVIDESKVTDKHLFRLAKAYQFVVLVSASLAGAVEGAGITGVRFVEPSAWRW